MRFSVYQESRNGARRINQDRMGYCFTRDALLMILADGLGGHALGEVAAQTALQTIARQFQSLAKPTVRDPIKFLEESILMAHREIHRYADVNDLNEVPRTTLVACLIQSGKAYWAHAGDSRFYLMRDGALLTRTRDHSKVENLLQQNRILPLEIAQHPDRNKIYNCLGSPNIPLIDTSGGIDLQPSDVLLLCSDGLWGSIDEELMISKMSAYPVAYSIPELIQTAIQNAGDTADNTTAVALIWESGNTIALQEMVQTDTLPLNAFTTSIQGGNPQDDNVSLDEADIERSIAEIRAAIEKSSNLTK